ncbi:caspase-1 isoform X1 [Monomorium pharaonis]|uniref:caspase-1 isoform X1 n=1 Tax=Monomorium pharaonis TaxID=307658 RepID=UPI0017460D00|nr:caspase-1 isoform X1 [Monomorium pharaonis]
MSFDRTSDDDARTTKTVLSDLEVQIPSPCDMGLLVIGEVEVKSEMDNIDNVSSTSPHRGRSYSEIDSIGYKRFVAFHRQRSKSVSSTDYYVSSEPHRTEIDMLEPCTTGSSQCNETRPDNLCFVRSSQSNEKKSDTVDAKLDATPVSPVNESSILTAFMPVSKDDSCYNMDHKNRGKCIIFNHDEFDYDQFERREGSTIDVKRLKITFGNLGFDVKVHNNLKYNEIMMEIEKMSQFDHKDNDCLCVITLTHGIHNDLISAKDVVYKSDQLWKPFTADKCVTLAGKPKLFFLQACRGEEADSAVLLQPRKLQKRTATDSTVTSYAIPAHADFLIAHSSIKGFFTWRNPSEGTWYIQSLCDILDKYGTKLNLMTMLTMTARKIATNFVSVHNNVILDNKKQVPSVTTMLIRDVYFPPKLINNSKKQE